MEKNENLVPRLHMLSETEKLALFNVEELETRLEMAAVSADTNGACGNTVKVTVNEVCW